jgi:DsbC/DsbD-like thiol-disulfide interchange protein
MTASFVQLVLTIAFLLPGAAMAAHSDWSHADQAQVRLLLGGERDGRLLGGVDVALETGWHTYWRNPGETGVPPVFDFSGSKNVARVDVLYPAPTRYDDGATVSLIYQDEVVFPLLVTPLAPGPVTLRAAISFGVCKEVCIPTQARAEVTQAGGERDPLTEARLASFLPRVPGAPEAGTFDVERVWAENKTLLVDVRMPESAFSDLFVEPPPGWYISQPRFLSRSGGVSRYQLSLAGGPPDAQPQGQVFGFVAVAGARSIEEAVEIR